jgi:hypothetical protein
MKYLRVKSFKVTWFLLLIFALGVVFFLIQIFFMHKLKLAFGDFIIMSSDNSAHSHDSSDTIINSIRIKDSNNFIRGRILKTQQIDKTKPMETTPATLTLTTITKKKQITQRNKIVHLKVNLDSYKNPLLVDQLPFFNRLNWHFNFSLIDEPFENDEQTNDELNLTEISINSANRIKFDSRGIEKSKLFLYKADAHGLFKCLNSDVI